MLTAFLSTMAACDSPGPTSILTRPRNKHLQHPSSDRLPHSIVAHEIEENEAHESFQQQSATNTRQRNCNPRGGHVTAIARKSYH